MRSLLLLKFLIGIGLVIFLWSAIPNEPAQESFRGFTLLFGPSIVFIIPVFIFAIIEGKVRAGYFLLLLAPALYFCAVWFFSLGRQLPFAPYIAGSISAFILLSFMKPVFFKSCSWKTVISYSLLTLIAQVPFLVPSLFQSTDLLGSASIIGLHIFLWYLIVGYAIYVLANKNHKKQQSLLSS